MIKLIITLQESYGQTTCLDFQF